MNRPRSAATDRAGVGSNAAPGTTIAAVLQAGAVLLTGCPEPRLEAERLLAHTLGVGRAELLANGREPLSAADEARFDRLLARREAGEPLAYLLGWTWFGDLKIEVTPDVLVPRPETELLAQWALGWCCARQQDVAVLDVGTGSGALAIAIASAAPNAMVTATDISRPALAVARRNVRRHDLTHRVRLVAADLLPEGDQQFDLLVANLPYVGTADGDLAAEVVAWEPHVALFAGPDGLDHVRRLLGLAPARLAPDGALGLELGWRQGEAVLALARRAFPAALVTLRQDLEDRDRLVVVERSG